MSFMKKYKKVVKEGIINVSGSGRLYIKTSDFLNQNKVQKTIDNLLKSDIVKEIEKDKLVKA